MARAGWCTPCAPSHHGRAPAGGSDVNQSPMPCTAARNLPPCRPAAWPPQECRTWPCQIRGLAIISGGNFFRRTGSPPPSYAARARIFCCWSAPLCLGSGATGLCACAAPPAGPAPRHSDRLRQPQRCHRHAFRRRAEGVRPHPFIPSARPLPLAPSKGMCAPWPHHVCIGSQAPATCPSPSPRNRRA